MRCPKCGYISFDHLDKCRKCNKNLETISAGLFGSTYNIDAPSFLKFDDEQRKDPSAEMEFSDERHFAADDEYVDDELAILVEDDDAEEDGEINFAGDKPAGMALSDAGDQDDGEIEIDFSQFEDTDEQANIFDEDEDEDEDELGQAKRDSLKIDIPPALSDISDLAPPAKSIEKDAEFSGASADSDFSDLDLDDLNFDLGLDGLDDTEQRAPTVPEKNVLSLDELDFTDTLAERDLDTAEKKDDLDLDLDLDFDLDLGGLSIHKDV